MTKLETDILNAVIFANRFHRTAFGNPKLDFSDRVPVPEEIEKWVAVIKTSPTVSLARSKEPCRKLIDQSQYKYIARGLFIWAFGADTPNGLILQRIGSIKLNKTRFEKLRKKVRAPFAQEILHAFYKRDAKPNWWHLLRTTSAWCITLADEAKYGWWVVRAMLDACPPEGSPPTLETRYRTDTVMQLIRRIRATEDFSAMQILADALQDAGYEREDLLKHYRDPNAVFSFGSWIFRATGNLEYTGATNDPVG